MNQASKTSIKKAVAISIIVALVVVGAVFASVFYFSPSLILGPCYSRTSGTWRDFVIVASSNGYNDSRDQPFVMTAQKDDCVLVRFTNRDGQAHGIAISNYEKGVIAQAYQTVSFKFQAAQTGKFQVGEQIFSTINAFTDKAGSFQVG